MNHGIMLQIAYKGSGFSGWASQADARTVEDTIAGAITSVDPKASRPRGTSRTDAGVHAEGQLAAFDTSIAIPPRGWVLTLNQHLPDDVSVRAATVVPTGFAPRFANKRKRYRYDVLLDKLRDPMLADRSWRIGYDVDPALVAEESKSIIGEHDFAAFRSAGDERANTVRCIYDVAVSRPSERLLRIHIEGNAFLYNMVRILVGTLIDVGRGRLPQGTISRALAERNRALAGPTAPPQGLTLESIEVALPEGFGGERWPL